MSFELNEIEVRILGCLAEKELATPDYYPLTLNALKNACNQRSNREPVVSYTVEVIEEALENLNKRHLIYLFYGSTSRVPKYKHRLPGIYKLDERETAIITVLMLRGPQTLGELKQRTARLCSFDTLAEVSETIESLIGREESLILRLPIQPGLKEARYAHLLSGEVDLENFDFSNTGSAKSRNEQRVEKIEQEVGELKSELSQLRQAFESFKSEFE